MLFEEEKEENLSQLRDKWDDCNRCPLRSKHVCHGQGDESAKIMVVGQNPTPNEGYTGHMMTDPGGQSIKSWFNNLISETRFKRTDLYFTNVTKCPATIRSDINKPVHVIRKDGTRGKAVVPAKECAEYLEDEIAIVNPDIIIALGQKALRRFATYDPMKKIPRITKKARGKVYDYRSRKFAAITMPIPISEEAEADLAEDFEFLIQILTGKKREDKYRRDIKKVLSIEEAFEQVAVCEKCDLCNKRTHPVFGTGNTRADIVFVGEAPGRQEDKIGSPFVGRSGRLLHEIMHKVGIDKKDVYVTNTIKCWPGPGNPDPTKLQLASCSDYLQSQIKSIKPKVIITLGKKALHAVASYSGPVGKVRGTHLDCSFSDSIIIPTWHPSYVLRKDNEFGDSNPIRRDFIEDLKQAQEI